jgi:hypothetical protein
MDTPITIRRNLTVGDTVKFVNLNWPKFVGIQGTVISLHAEGRTALLSTGNMFRTESLSLVPPPPADPVADYLQAITDTVPADPLEPEYTGGSVNYYRIHVEQPTTAGVAPYAAECNDIIEALEMSYAEGNAFKALWRMCAARQGMSKKGYTDGLYDAQKVVFFGERLVAQRSAATE